MFCFHGKIREFQNEEKLLGKIREIAVTCMRPSKLYYLDDKSGGDFWRCPITNKFRISLFCLFAMTSEQNLCFFKFNIGSNKCSGDKRAKCVKCIIYPIIERHFHRASEGRTLSRCSAANYNTLRHAVNWAMLKSSTIGRNRQFYYIIETNGS